MNGAALGTGSPTGLPSSLRIWGPFPSPGQRERGARRSHRASARCCVWKVTLSRRVWGGSWPMWGRARGQSCSGCGGTVSGLRGFTSGALISFQCLWHSGDHTREMCQWQAQTGWADGTDHSQLQCWESTEAWEVQTQGCACMRLLRQVVSEVGNVEQKILIFFNCLSVCVQWKEGKKYC